MRVSSVRKRKSDIQRFSTGPWKGVRTTTDPLDDPDDLLTDATNLYIPDPTGKSGAYERPGFSLLNNGTALTTSATPFRGQSAFSHITLAGVTYNFIVMKGKLFRVDSSLTVFTDVSPAGITIDPAVTTRVYATTFADQLIVTDGVNKPWLATNLSGSPITGTYIDYDGSGTTWAAFGPFVVYGGSVFCILSQYNSVSRRTDISWSNPGDASTGWQQTNYDFNWTLEQNGSEQLYGLFGTNTGLYYWRERSIGLISGSVGPNLSTSATHDQIGKNVGTTAPQSIVQFGSNIYFTDQIGRPYRLNANRDLEPIWLQMRAIVDASTASFSGATSVTATAALEPNLNLYLIAIWSPNPAQSSPPVECYAFHAETGIYFGRWQIGSGFNLETLGTFTLSSGSGALIVLGSKAAPTSTSNPASGFVWMLNGLVSVGSLITTEAGVFITTEDGISTTSEGTAANWLDGSDVPVVSATTGRIGYSADRILNADRVTALLGSTAPVTLSLNTSALPVTVEGTPTPSTTQDSVSRLTCGMDGVQGRGLVAKLSPTTAISQWSLQSVVVDGIVSLANPDEV